MDTATQDGISANSQNTSERVDEDKKRMDRDGPNVSKKKRKTRSRKKKQAPHSKRHDVDRSHGVPTSSTDETPEVVLPNSCSQNPPEPKTQTRSGSKKRFSGLFKRKSRSESRSRSTSETDLSKLGKNSTSKRHQSAEDIKRGTTAPSENVDAYEVYDVTKQPRNRLQRMTVRDAVRERRRYTSGSRQRLSMLEKQIEIEEGTKGSSLPDVSSAGLDADTRTKTSPTNVNVRGSASLPRQKLKRKDRSETESVKVKSDNLKTPITPDPVSIEVQPSETLPEEVKPVSILKHPKPVEPSPHISVITSHSVLVHESPKGQDSLPQTELRGQLNTQQPSSKSPSSDKLHPEQSAQTKEQTTTRSHSPVISVPHSRSRAASRWKMAIEDVKAKRRKETLSKFLELSRSLPSYSSSSIARMQVRDLSPFCPFNIARLASQKKDLSPSKILSPNQTPRDLSPWRVASPNQTPRDLSPWRMSSTNQTPRDLSPWRRLREVVESPASGNVLKPKVDSEIKATKPSPDIVIATPSPPMKDAVGANDDVKSSETTYTTMSDNNEKEQHSKDKSQFLTAPQLGRSLSVGGRSQNSTKTCYRSNSASSEPAGGTKSLGGDAEQNNVPVMGTSVQQIYRRAFTPKRRQSVENKEPTLQTSDKLPSSGGDAFEQSHPDSKENKSQDRQDNSPDRQTLSPDRQTLSPDRRTLSLSPDRTTDSESAACENSEFDRTLERRGRDSQRRRYHGRSFRRKKEKEEDEAEAKEKDQEEKKEVYITRIAVEMCDRSTQTSDLDLSVKTSKKLSKLKKNNKKNKKLKQTALPVHEYPVKEEKIVIHASKENVHEDEPPVEDKPSEIKSEVQDEPPKQETKDEVDEEHKDSPKPKPKKLSFAAIVLLKAKLAKRKKLAEEDKDKSKQIHDADIPYDIFTIENEINLQKLAEIKETDILDDEIVEPEMSIEIPRKKLRFEPMPSDEPVQSEEPLPPFRPRSSIRRNSTIREKRKKCLHCCKRFTAFLFSHIGLCSLVVAYTIMGGFIFKAIEGPFEEKTKTFIRSEREHVATKVLQHAVALQLSDMGRDNFTTAVREQLQAFQEVIFRETKEHGWDGKDAQSDVPEQQWSFASSLLYAITVMTTIGYGHVAPKTDEGRIVTIAYAVLGIPLTLLCLTNIGDVMATGFRLLYGKICCGVCCRLFGPSRRHRIPDIEKGIGAQVLTSEEEEADKPKEVIRVPTSLCLLLIAGYIFAGAMLFSLWEKWDYLTGSYFCFITLSTIGFGDIVPGTDLNAWAQEEKLVLCAMYLVFGLSLIAMCFNLVQEDVKAKCRWLGTKIGIIDKPQSSV